MAKADSLVFADAHIGGGWASRSIHGDAEFALDQILSQARKHRVKRVLGLGDLIDKQRNRSRPINTFFNFIDGLQALKIEAWFIEGNHDQDDPPWFEAHAHARSLHKELVETEAGSIYGINSLPYGAIQEAFEEIPEDTGILVCHQSWGEWMGSITSPQCDFAQVPHVERLISGDLHQCIIKRHKGKDGQDILCCSPGATFMQAINEPNEHFVILIMDDGTFKKQKLESRQVIDWDVISYKEDMDRFMEDFEGRLAEVTQHAAANEFPETLMQPLLRITYSHRLTDTVRRVDKLVDGRAHVFYKELPPEEKQATKGAKKERIGAAVTPLSTLPKVVDQEKNPNVFELCHTLLQAGMNAEEAFAEWRARYLNEE